MCFYMYIVSAPDPRLHCFAPWPPICIVFVVEDSSPPAARSGSPSPGPRRSGERGRRGPGRAGAEGILVRPSAESRFQIRRYFLVSMIK